MLTVKRVIGVASLLAVTLLLLFIQYVFVKENRQPLQLTNNSDEWYYDNPSTLTYPHDRFKAALFTFVKNDTASLTKLRHTIRNIEDQFNKERGYPYIIFTDQELSYEYMELASSLTKATVRFEKVDNVFYGYHPETDQDRAAQTRADMSQIMFGDSEDYRFQSRFMAGTIYRHPIMQELNFGWRFEAGTEYICPIDQDLFQYMYENNKTLSFVIALYEYTETIPTLYETVLDFASQHNEWITSNQDPDSLWKFIQDPFTKNFNGCHLWNNFQV
ncbi:hypothetical protein CU097_012678 [Rhizopus azygosporus]|uniref:Alpha 1,2-mannosyltransferase 2.4.1 n=1 Tax=Rhizopus azygosporus TaxID=86630 RepID=A0A367K1K2_RHIAZ|nr:hypothetical protein CU097_012678 [Rhizopus azygosporus]